MTHTQNITHKRRENYHDRSVSEFQAETTFTSHIQRNKLIYSRRKHQTNLISTSVMFPFLSQYLHQNIHNNAFSIEMKIIFSSSEYANLHPL